MLSLGRHAEPRSFRARWCRGAESRAEPPRHRTPRVYSIDRRSRCRRAERGRTGAVRDRCAAAHSNVAERAGSAHQRWAGRADVPVPRPPRALPSEGSCGRRHGLRWAQRASAKSRGLVALGSPDPRQAADVPNYMEHRTTGLDDRRRADLNGDLREGRPLGELSTGMMIGPDSHSDDDILDHVRARVQTLYHPVVTCAGRRPGAVVERSCA